MSPFRLNSNSLPRSEEFVNPMEIVPSAATPRELRRLAEEASLSLPRYFKWKERMARLAALLLLIPGLPIIGVLLLLVRLTSRGPALFRQQRVGKHGRLFTMLKIRTMIFDAEAATGPVWSSDRDPRVTRLGYWLRKLHLDELPQLINVLAGEMSLVGPRPERPEIVVRLAQAIPGYCRRLAVRPGITGLAQINLPPDTSLECVRRKLVLDLEYIHTARVLLDLRMLVCSLLRLMGLSGEVAMNLLLLRRDPVVPAAWYVQDQEEAVVAADVSSSLAALRAGGSSNGEETAPANGGSDPWPVMQVTPLTPR
jgi:lipopolysaccharide/colanic/teichoic acid biosynthesis glycosyltransferase